MRRPRLLISRVEHIHVYIYIYIYIEKKLLVDRNRVSTEIHSTVSERFVARYEQELFSYLFVLAFLLLLQNFQIRNKYG